MQHASIRTALTAGASAALLALAACSSSSSPSPAGAAQPDRPFLDRFHVVSQIASTVPHNGDVNPYGIAVVPQSDGRLVRGHVLVTNFNAKANIQGTGTTVMQVGPTDRLASSPGWGGCRGQCRVPAEWVSPRLWRCCPAAGLSSGAPRRRTAWPRRPRPAA